MVEGDNCTEVHVCLDVNKQKADAALERLNDLTGGNVDTEWSVVVELDCAKGGEETLKKTFDYLLTDKDCKLEVFKGPRRDIVHGQVGFKSHAGDDKVFLSLTPPE